MDSNFRECEVDQDTYETCEPGDLPNNATQSGYEIPVRQPKQKIHNYENLQNGRSDGQRECFGYSRSTAQPNNERAEYSAFEGDRKENVAILTGLHVDQDTTKGRHSAILKGMVFAIVATVVIFTVSLLIGFLLSKGKYLKIQRLKCM